MADSSAGSLELTLRQLGRLRMRGQVLTPDEAGPSVAEATRSVIGLQAQSWPAAVLSARPRTSGLTATDIEASRIEERSVVRTWAMRGTLFLIAAQDLRPFVGLLGPGQIALTARRYAQLGLDDGRLAKCVRVIGEALAARGAMSRAEIGEELVSRSVVSDAGGQLLPHVLRHAALLGVTCQGPYRGKTETYVLVDEWLGARAGAESRANQRDGVLEDLARRYLAAFGPAEPRDFATWSGLRMGDARRAWETMAAEIIEVTVAGRTLSALRGTVPTPAEIDALQPATRLVPSWDTYLVGYASRELMVAEPWKEWVWPGGGVIHPTVVEDGLIVGSWRVSPPRRGRATVTVRRFGTWGSARLARVTAEAEDVGRFLGVEIAIELVG